MKSVEIIRSQKMIRLNLLIQDEKRDEFKEMAEKQFPGSKLMDDNICELVILNYDTEADFCQFIKNFD